jgi:hypothetical protein
MVRSWALVWVAEPQRISRFEAMRTSDTQRAMPLLRQRKGQPLPVNQL